MKKYRLDVVYFEEEDVICTSEEDDEVIGGLSDPDMP